IAYVGNSRYGWYSPGSPGYGPSDRFDRAFFDSLFNKGIYDIGMTFADSKAVYRSSSMSGSVYRYLQFSLNLLGDPETTIWTVSTPEPPALSVIAESPNKVNIDTSFVVNATISNSGTEMATGVNAEIVLPEGLSTTESTSQDLGDLGGKESKLVSWNVNAGSSTGVYDITINASAENITGLASSVTTVEVVTPDPTPPIVSLIAPTDGATVNDSDTVIFKYIPEDEESGIADCKLKIDGKIWRIDYEIIEGVENEFAVSWINAGVHTWSVSCVDDSLEMNEGSSEIRTLTVKDTTPPEGFIEIMDNSAGSAGSGYTSDVEPDLYLNAWDADYMAFSCNNESFGDWIPFVEYPVPVYSDFNMDEGAGCEIGDGLKTIYVKFKDEAGNEGDSASDITFLDRMAPEIIDITGDTSATTGDSKEISLTVFDEGEIVEAIIYIDSISGNMMRIELENEFTYNYTVPSDSVAPHTYYVVVSDMAGNSSRFPETGTYTITVTDNDAPVVIAGPDRSVSIGEVVMFNASESSDNIGIENYNWDFGDGNSESEMIVNHTYTAAGTFTATLTVTDDAGMTATDTVVITVMSNPNQPPVANAGSDQVIDDIDGSGSELVTLDGFGSSDPEGDTLVYEWKEGDIILSSSASFSYDFTIGAHTVTLTVTDNSGATDTDTVDIKIQDKVTIESAEYDTKKATLTIKATSSAGREAVLTASAGSFENVTMRYDSRKNVFKVTIRKITPDPGSVTVESSLGGSGVYPSPLEE
ncbi:MAG: PKD domain-containing protein, partial [Candidatus Omnitrophica bacterium]|nr:PKD domain-containing protein [Candidatus Omnitrophota bacterium]